MKTITTILTFLFIGFFIWIVYFVWVIFYSEGVVNNKPVSVQEFRTEVNYAYYNPEERMLKIDSELELNPNYEARLWESIEAFDNLENSTAQRELKKEFESLLTMYLRVDNLYSHEELLKIKSTDVKIFDYDSFYKILNIYIRYLQKNPNQKNHKQLYRIVDKNLKNFYQLMKNSNDFGEYLVSLIYLERFLESLKCSNNFVALFEQYPLVNDEIFFKKSKLDKENHLEIWKRQLSDEQKEHVIFMKTMNTNHDYIDKMLNEIYRREMIAIRDGSAEARKNHEEYIEKLKHKNGTFSQEFMELWNLSVKKKINMKSRTYIYFAVLGYEYMTKFHFDTYERHKLVNKLHRRFLNDCNVSTN